ncbi:hypothetical protein [Methylomagnum ishizawai]|uniref:hypothetical protein n=1 Tax=Methylomagnum ishizawai TaxID=1760988 RepID=UPI000A15F842|nr:hypothetical protein [Methylomagnum ishizawai]
MECGEPRIGVSDHRDAGDMEKVGFGSGDIDKDRSAPPGRTAFFQGQGGEFFKNRFPRVQEYRIAPIIGPVHGELATRRFRVGFEQGHQTVERAPLACP